MMFTYTKQQAHEIAPLLRFYPWAFYWCDAQSSFVEFCIDVQGTHRGLATEDDCAAQWMIVQLCKCEIQARTTHETTWRDHRLRLIRQLGLPY